MNVWSKSPKIFAVLRYAISPVSVSAVLAPVTSAPIAKSCTVMVSPSITPSIRLFPLKSKSALVIITSFTPSMSMSTCPVPASITSTLEFPSVIMSLEPLASSVPHIHFEVPVSHSSTCSSEHPVAVTSFRESILSLV